MTNNKQHWRIQLPFFGGGVGNPDKKLTPKKRKTGRIIFFALWGKYTCFNTGKLVFKWFSIRYHPPPIRLWGSKENFGIWNLKNAKYHLSRHACYFRQHLYLLNRYKCCHKSLALTDGLFLLLPMRPKSSKFSSETQKLPEIGCVRFRIRFKNNFYTLNTDIFST